MMTAVHWRKPPIADPSPTAARPAARAPSGTAGLLRRFVVERYRLMLTVIATACIAACATSSAPDYVEPAPSEASAKVRVVNTRPYAYFAAIAVFDSVACFDKANLGMTGGDSKDTVRIGMLDSKPPSASTIERHVRAGEPLVIGPRAVFPTSSLSEVMHAMMVDTQEQVRSKQAGVCRIPSFVPKRDEQYEVLVDLSPAHCSVKPYRLVGANGSVQREEVPVDMSRISTYEFDMKCFR